MDTPPAIIKLLAHDLRWQLVKALSESDYRVNELVTQIAQPLNSVSYHLKQLREGDLITMRRSEADGRDNYYSLDLDQLRTLYNAAGSAIHSAVVADESQIVFESKPNVLFVCTHNSARSQMAEGLMRHISDGQIPVWSAGSHPTRIHSDAIHTMDGMGIDIRGQRVTHLSEIENHPFDIVITVCDWAREICPTFPGKGRQIHWGFPDPADIDDPDARQKAFTDTAQRLSSRIRHLLHTLTQMD